jgi:hypothetical protein
MAYYRTRYYDPAVGRFSAGDPAAEVEDRGLHRYAYVRGNPVIGSDPWGLWTVHSSCGGAAAAVDAAVETAIRRLRQNVAGRQFRYSFHRPSAERGYWWPIPFSFARGRMEDGLELAAGELNIACKACKGAELGEVEGSVIMVDKEIGGALLETVLIHEIAHYLFEAMNMGAPFNMPNDRVVVRRGGLSPTARGPGTVEEMYEKYGDDPARPHSDLTEAAARFAEIFSKTPLQRFDYEPWP